ncbi:XrtA system polysaccharide chain length determinant [Photobacterium nomapromontoriensis]|uniref:XrtA system polysaccharide chain length determinant n=1 Tax=Photobacterium nomapromontoriensis TaxID=2910237 RepID=UPI003D140688
MKEQLELLQQYFYGVWLKRRLAIIIIWTLCLSGWTVITILPNEYTSEARVYADTRTILKPLLRGIAIDNDPTKELQLMVKTLLSRRNLETIARYTEADLMVDTTNDYDELLDDLKNNIKIRSAGKENLFTISYFGTDPKYVKDVVQAALDVFVENAVGHKKQDSKQANEFLVSQLALYEDRLLESERELAEFKRLNSAYVIGSDNGYALRSESLKYEIEETRLKRKEALSALASARRQVKNETVGTYSQQSTIKTEFDIRLETLQARLDQLLFRYTEKHPDVKETRRQIDTLHQQRSTLIRGGQVIRPDTPMLQEMKLNISNIENSIASLTARESVLIEKLNEVEGKLLNLPKIEAQLTSLMRNYKVTKDQYHQLLERRESAMISQDVDAKSDQISFKIIDPPLLPRIPSGPNRPLLLSAVLILSAGAALSIVFAISQSLPVVYSSNQLYQQTQISVYGEVSSGGIDSKDNYIRNQVMNSTFHLFLILVGFIMFFIINSLSLVQLATLKMQGLL